MNIEDSVIILKNIKKLVAIEWKHHITDTELSAIETLLTAYEEKEKIIDEMAGYLAIIRDCPNENCGANLDCKNRCNNDDRLLEECWKMYFEREIKQ